LDISDEVLRNLRRIIRAIDLHSKRLAGNQGLTGSQALIMRELVRAEEPLPISTLAGRVSLSHATVTDILNRLERKGHVIRTRDERDKRRILVDLTRSGRALIDSVPSLLQEQFLSRFRSLADWEQTAILSNLQRVATLMDAESLEAAPFLASGTIGTNNGGTTA